MSDLQHTESLPEALLMAELQSIRMRECSVTNKVTEQNLPKVLSIHLNMNVEYDKRQESPDIFAHATFEVSARYEEGKDAPLVIAVSYISHYKIEPGNLSDDAFNLFGATVGVHDVWPHWREFLANTTWRMGYPRIPVPPSHNMVLKAISED